MLNRYNYLNSNEYIRFLAIENLKKINMNIINKIDFIMENKQFLNKNDNYYKIYDMDNDPLLIDFKKENIEYSGSINDLYKFFKGKTLLFIDNELAVIVKNINKNILTFSKMDL